MYKIAEEIMKKFLEIIASWNLMGSLI